MKALVLLNVANLEVLPPMYNAYLEVSSCDRLHDIDALAQSKIGVLVLDHIKIACLEPIGQMDPLPRCVILSMLWHPVAPSWLIKVSELSLIRCPMMQSENHEKELRRHCRYLEYKWVD